METGIMMIMMMKTVLNDFFPLSLAFVWYYLFRLKHAAYDMTTSVLMDVNVHQNP